MKSDSFSLNDETNALAAKLRQLASCNSIVVVVNAKHGGGCQLS